MPSGRPRLRLIKTERGKESPQRDDVARKAAPRVTHGVWGTQWKVEKEFRDSPGLAFVRRYLSLYDYSQLEWIRVRRSPRPYFPWKDPFPIFGTCVPPEETSSGLFRVNCNLLTGLPYPVRLWDEEEPSSGERQTFFVNDESEAVVATIALQVGLYLGDTGQIVGVDATDVLQAAVEAYRRNIGGATSSEHKLPGTLARPEWCVWCGKPLPKGGGSQSFCSGGRCRTTWHNSQRRARLAARRGKMVCQMCGKMFTPKQRGAKTCSPACRQKKYRELRKDRSNPGHDDHHEHDGPGDVDHQDRA